MSYATNVMIGDLMFSDMVLVLLCFEKGARYKNICCYHSLLYDKVFKISAGINPCSVIVDILDSKLVVN